jgi:hypothetical protein
MQARAPASTSSKFSRSLLDPKGNSIRLVEGRAGPQCPVCDIPVSLRGPTGTLRCQSRAGPRRRSGAPQRRTEAGQKPHRRNDELNATWSLRRPFISRARLGRLRHADRRDRSGSLRRGPRLQRPPGIHDRGPSRCRRPRGAGSGARRRSLERVVVAAAPGKRSTFAPPRFQNGNHGLTWAKRRFAMESPIRCEFR